MLLVILYLNLHFGCLHCHILIPKLIFSYNYKGNLMGI